jgi:hypothetical protein
VQLSLQAEDHAAGSAAYAAIVDNVLVGSLVVRRTAVGTTEVAVDWLLLSGRAQAADLLSTLEELARHTEAAAVVVDTVDELTRLVARAGGYTGGLRGRLRRDLQVLAGAAPDRVAMNADTLGHAIAELVPDIAVDVRAKGLTRLSGRPPKLVDVVASDPAVRRTVTLRMPNRADAIPEAVAEILDTAIRVLRRFPVEIHRISCETGSYDLATGQHAGETFPNVGMVYLNGSYVLADDLERMQRAWIEHNPGVRRRPLVPPPHSSIDGITAHELWHRIEDAHHQADWIAIHRALGTELGVETLEHALRGRSTDAPPAWHHAYERLVDEVSQYATTNPREAKAEMFMQWWCRSGTTSPLVARFGELIEAALPVNGRA